MRTITVLAVFLLQTLFASAALAHNPNESYIYVDAAESAFGGSIEMRVQEAGVIFDLDTDGDGTTSRSELEAGATAVHEAFLERLQFGIVETVPEITFSTVKYLGEGIGEIAQFNFTLNYEGEVPEHISISFNSDFDRLIAGHRSFVLVRNNSRTGLANNEAYIAHVFGSGQNTAQISLLGDTAGQALVRFVEQGIWHILIGFDHVAFLIALLLPSVLIATQGQWKPAQNLRTAAWSIFKIATTFTIAHSITLTLAAVGYFVPPSAPIEIAIALSIVVAALLNIFSVRAILALPFVFLLGLLHGFGFAFVLEPLGVARNTLVHSLLGFNIGVEIGQLAIIVVLFPVLYLLRNQKFYVPLILKGGSVLLIAVATFWFGERALGFIGLI